MPKNEARFLVPRQSHFEIKYVYSYMSHYLPNYICVKQFRHDVLFLKKHNQKTHSSLNFQFCQKYIVYLSNFKFAT